MKKLFGGFLLAAGILLCAGCACRDRDALSEAVIDSIVGMELGSWQDGRKNAEEMESGPGKNGKENAEGMEPAPGQDGKKNAEGMESGPGKDGKENAEGMEPGPRQDGKENAEGADPEKKEQEKLKEEAEKCIKHEMEVLWFGDPPSCTQGGYRIEVCALCGWVDEEASGSVPPLEHKLEAKELQHGNCMEDTIIVYTCRICGEQIQYERSPEPDEHQWRNRTITVWDEGTHSFQEEEIRCCERCNTVFVSTKTNGKAEVVFK